MADHSDPVHDDARTLAAFVALLLICVALWAALAGLVLAAAWILTHLIGAIA